MTLLNHLNGQRCCPALNCANEHFSIAITTSTVDCVLTKRLDRKIAPEGNKKGKKGLEKNRDGK